MFNDLNNQTPADEAKNAVDDIFAETDVGSNKLSQDKVNIESQPAGLSAQSYSEAEGEQADNRGSKLKSLLIIALAVVILIAAAYLIYSKFISVDSADELTLDQTPVEDIVVAPETPTTPQNNVGTVVIPEPDQNVVTPDPVSPNIIATNTVMIDDDLITTSTALIDDVIIAPEPVDSDNDNLSDLEEIELGTNINLIDSDFDGISDYEEVKVYHTNPLNPDTDGDSYNDGDEVKNGYNPNGEGEI